MPIVRKLREFLDAHHVKYVVISHSRAYTASETAATAHIRGKEMAKTLIAKVDGRPVMLVLPSSYAIYLEMLRETLDASEVTLAPEEELREMFPGCELGAMPPFGNLYGLDVYADRSLAEDQEIAFNAGSHTELIKLAWQDYERLVGPQLKMFSLKSYPTPRVKESELSQSGAS